MAKRFAWHRDLQRAVAKQKLDYIYFNPVSGKWQLAKDDISYYYSSARFYETGIDELRFFNNTKTLA